MPDILDNYQYQDNRGGASLGFLPAAVAAGSVAGPVGTVVGVVVGAIGSLFKLFGGGTDDQATSYVPPLDSATKFVSFDDHLSKELVAFDMSPAGTARAVANGNLEKDLRSYYSIFISNSTQSGASPAAAKVVTDIARKHGVSLSRAGEIILSVAGVLRLAQPLFRQPQQPPRPQPPAQAPQPPRPIQQSPAPIRPAPIRSVYAPTPMAIASGGGQEGTSPWIWVGLGALALFAFTRNR